MHKILSKNYLRKMQKYASHSLFFYSLKSLDIFWTCMWSLVRWCWSLFLWFAWNCIFLFHSFTTFFPLSFAFQLLRLCWQILQSSFLFFPFRHSDKRTWQRSSWWQEGCIIYILRFLCLNHGHTRVSLCFFPFIEVNRISAFISRFSDLRFETFLCWETWHA